MCKNTDITGQTGTVLRLLACPKLFRWETTCSSSFGQSALVPQKLLSVWVVVGVHDVFLAAGVGVWKRIWSLGSKTFTGGVCVVTNCTKFDQPWTRNTMLCACRKVPLPSLHRKISFCVFNLFSSLNATLCLVVHPFPSSDFFPSFLGCCMMRRFAHPPLADTWWASFGFSIIMLPGCTFLCCLPPAINHLDGWIGSHGWIHCLAHQEWKCREGALEALSASSCGRAPK